MKQTDSPQSMATKPHCMMSRRDFLFNTALSLTAVAIPLSASASIPAQIGEHPRQHIASLTKLRTGKPLYFNYPDNGPYSENMLVKLGRPAGAGIGPDQDIVAFSLICTHMGGQLKSGYIMENASLGPCPLHLSSFDLTRHGILITGQATQSLPQIMLESEGDDVFATGVLGLLYGHYEGLIAHD